MDERLVIDKFNALRREADELWRRLNELEADRAEHALVLETLKPLDEERRCFRLVGGVLVQRTVAEAVPAVARNMESLEELIRKLGASLDEKNREVSAWQEKYKIRVRSEGPGGGEQPAAEGSHGAPQGVLVEGSDAPPLPSVPE